MERLSEARDIIKDASIFSSATYISQGLSFIKGVLNARLLGPALYGLWSGLNIILNYSAYLHLGTVNAMNREIPYYAGRGIRDKLIKIRDTTFSISMAISFMASFVLLGLTFLFWKRFSFYENIGLITIAFLIPIGSAVEFYQTLLISLKRFVLVSRGGIIFSILSIIITLIMVPAFKVYGVYIVALIIPVLYCGYLFFKEPYFIKVYFDLEETVQLIKIGFPLISADFLYNTVIDIAGIIVLSMLGKESMGYYAIAMLSSRFLMYFPNSITRTLEPYIYQSHGALQDISKLKPYLFKPTLIMSFLFPVMIVFYYTGVGFFIRHFLPMYSPSVNPFFVILMARFFVSFSPSAPIFLTAVNKQKYFVPIYLVSILIMCLSSFIFIKMGFGILAVSYGVLLSFFFAGATIYLFAISHYIENPFRCLGYLVGLCLPVLYISLAMIFNEIIIPSSSDLVADIWKSFIKLCILCVVIVPFIIVAVHKIPLIREMVRSFNFKPELAIKIFK